MRRLFSSYRPLFRYEQETPRRSIFRFVEFLLFWILALCTYKLWKQLSKRSPNEWFLSGWVKDKITSVVGKLLRLQPSTAEDDNEHGGAAQDPRTPRRLTDERREAERVAAEKRAKEEAEVKAAAEKKAKEEAEAKAAAEKKAKEEAEAKAAAEKKAKEEKAAAEKRAKEEAEAKAAAEKKAKEEAEAKAAAEKKAKEEAEAKAAAEQEAEDNEALLEASVHYNEAYRDRIVQFDRPNVEEEPAKPFLGFSLADIETRSGKPCLVVDGVYQDGPASLVGVNLNDELVSINNYAVGSIGQAKRLVAQHCHVAKVTQFSFNNPTKGAVYTVKLWVMTTEARYADRPFYFDVSKHTKDVASPTKLENGHHQSSRRLLSQPRLLDTDSK